MEPLETCYMKYRVIICLSKQTRQLNAA